MSTFKRYWYWCSRTMICNFNRYAKTNTRSEQEEVFYKAIQKAREHTLSLSAGDERLRAVDMVLINATRTYEGAALKIHVSRKTVDRWVNDFVYLVGRYAGYELNDDKQPKR